MLATLAVLLVAQQNPPFMPEPPRVAWPIQDCFKNEAIGALGDIRVRTLEKQIRIIWASPGEIFSEVFDLAFWPTAVASLGDAQILVAGKKPSNGKTIIQRWDLSWSVLPDIDNPTTVAKTTIYIGNSPGKKVVRCMVEMIGIAHRVLVVFSDSGDLYMFDTQTGQHWLQYSGQQFPKMEIDTLEHMHVAEHPTRGHAYILQCRATFFDDGGVVFYDEDMDGDLDVVEEIDTVDWPSQVTGVEWVQVF
jgi:hypothetical protein